jgi:hypothetical protein
VVHEGGQGLLALLGRLAGTHVPHDELRLVVGREVGGVDVGAHLDVVAEPARLLVGVGVAADEADQRDEGDDLRVRRLQAGVLGQIERDHPLAEHVLHGLAETEIDPEGQHRHQFAEAGPRSAHEHGRTLTRTSLRRQ